MQKTKEQEGAGVIFFLFPREIIAVLCLCRSAPFVRCLFPASPAGKPHLQLTDDRIVPQPLMETCVPDCTSHNSGATLHPVK